MEVTFYHDDNLGSYDQQSSPSSVGSACSTDIGAVSAICRPYTTDGLNKSTVLRGLDLNINQHGQVKLPALPSEGQRNIINHQASQRQQGVITAALPGHTLASPDVNMLKLGSPDLERLISNNQHNGQQYMQHKMHLASGVTEEQEMYAQGFERELERIKSKSASDPDVQGTVIQSENGINETSHCPVITSGAGHPLARQRQYVNNDQYYGHGNIVPGMALNRSAEVTIHHMSNPMVTQLKEEPPQTVPVMSNTPPPMSPIDLISQEMLKSERKRQRNRVAASKCRKRKLERISRLEDKVKGLKTQNMELSTNANILRQQVAELKSKVMAHVNSGCQLMMNQQQVNF